MKRNIQKHDDVHEYKEKGIDNLKETQKWALANYYKHPEFSNWSTGFAFCLDYIFFRASDKRVVLQSILEIPSMDMISEGIKDETVNSELPNNTLPSDHFRIEAVFSIY